MLEWLRLMEVEQWRELASGSGGSSQQLQPRPRKRESAANSKTQLLFSPLPFVNLTVVYAAFKGSGNM